MALVLLILNERYKILVGKEINIQKSETHFIVDIAFNLK